jgi:hypothetical protein
MEIDYRGALAPAQRAELIKTALSFRARDELVHP